MVVKSADNEVNNLIRAIEIVGLSLAINIGIEI